MANLSVPYLLLRSGRPRWEPGPKLRAAGLKGRDLKDESGAWLGMEAAIAAARAINAQIQAGKTDGRMPAALKRAPKTGRTAEALWQRWRTSPAFLRLAASTRDDYEGKLEVFLAEFAEAPLAAITKPQLYGFWEELYNNRGHHMANGVLACVSSMFSYAEIIGWRTENSNPARNMGRKQTKPRCVLWSPAECQHLVTIADGMGLASVGDAALIALHSGQRQADVLALPPRLIGDNRIKLTQFKRGAIVDCPMTDQLAARIDVIRARWRNAGVITRETIVVRDGDGTSYSGDFFRDRFAAVRLAAIEGMPSIAGKRFQDLRDTAVTRLALADCTIPQIGSITGHSPKTITQVLQHYLVMQPEIADQAIAKLQAWMSREGVAV